MSRRALLVGIDTYPRLEAEYQLASCVRDVELMADVLTGRFGFSAREVTVLRNGEATREGVLRALEALAAQAGPEDVVVFHYSGHGSRRCVARDDPDCYEETLVPADSGRGAEPNRDISGAELYGWLLQLTEVTPHLTLILDTCYSGTVLRDASAAPIRRVEDDPRPAGSAVRKASFGAAFRDLGPSGWLPLSDRYVLLAACRDWESASVYRAPGGNGPDYGVLTYFLCRELLRAEPESTWRDVFEPLQRAVSARDSSQTPQLEGARDRQVFGVRDLVPQRFLPVRAREGGVAHLAGGAVHGLTPGSEWEVYAAGTKRFEGAAARQGRLRLTDVEAVRSRGEIVEEVSEGAVQAGGRAVEVRHGFAAQVLPVAVEGPAGERGLLAALSAKLEASPLLRPAGGEEAAPVRVCLLAPRDRVAPGDPLPQLGPVGEAVWAVAGPGGELLRRPWPVREAGAVARVVACLERRAGYLATLELAPPQQEDPLRRHLQVELERLTPDGTWVSAAGPSGEAFFREGERLGLEIRHNDLRRLFIHVLDLGLAGGVELVYPVEGAHDVLIEYGVLTIGKRPGEELWVTVPEALPPRTGPVVGWEHLKIFATTEETDLSWLGRAGERKPGTGSLLERLLAVANRGEVLREGVPVAGTAGAWTTVTRSFAILPSEP